jgi:hypothetical protein
MAVVLFPNTQVAIRAERLLQVEGVTGKLIPIPRQLGTGCGLAFRFPEAESERVRSILDRAGLHYGAIHLL